MYIFSFLRYSGLKPFSKTKLLLAFSLCVLLACGSEESEQSVQIEESTEPVTNETTQKEDILVPMEDLIVDESFNWKVTQDLTLVLTLLNVRSEPFVGQEIEIYSNATETEQGLFMGGSLLFSGWPNNQGTLTLHHQVKKGVNKLMLKVIDKPDGSYTDIPLSSSFYDQETGAIHMTLYL